MRLILPFPVSTNVYWRNVNGRTLISKKGREYSKAVIKAVLAQGGAKWLKGRLSVHVKLYPPDNRKRDVDNFGGKSLLDALSKAHVYCDDSQIDRLLIERMENRKGGVIEVDIRGM